MNPHSVVKYEPKPPIASPQNESQQEVIEITSKGHPPNGNNKGLIQLVVVVSLALFTYVVWGSNATIIAIFVGFILKLLHLLLKHR